MGLQGRRRFLFGSAAIFAAPAVLAQPRRARIGLLQTTTLEATRHLLDPFRRQLAKLGWVEGRNYELIAREAHGDPARYTPLAAELIALMSTPV